MTLPTPKNFSTGSELRNAGACFGVMSVSPSGLWASDPNFASSLLKLTPAEAVNAVSSLIRSLMVRGQQHSLREVAHT